MDKPPNPKDQKIAAYGVKAHRCCPERVVSDLSLCCVRSGLLALDPVVMPNQVLRGREDKVR